MFEGKKAVENKKNCKRIKCFQVNSKWASRNKLSREIQENDWINIVNNSQES